MTMFDPDAIKEAVTKDGHTMKDFLREADVDESTWYRWTREKDPIRPNIATLEKVQDALDKLGIKTAKKRGRK